MPSQIALPLSPPGSGKPGRIVIGNANSDACEAIAKPEGWPFNTAVLTGPARSGKTLLAQWAQSRGIAAIDGADKWDEAKLFHRWNKAQETGERLLLVSDAQPWDIALPDLRSRLAGSLQLEIGVPDDDMVARLIEAIAEQRGLVLAEGALDYLVPRAERSFAAIEQLVIAIDRLSLERKVPATMSLWRDALETICGPEQARLL